MNPLPPSDFDYFSQSAMIPSILITDFRIVGVAPRLVRLTLYERSVATGEDGAILQLLHVRGSFCMDFDSFKVLAGAMEDFMAKVEAKGEVPKATNEGTRGLN